MSRCPRPGGLYDGDDEASRVPGKPTRTHAMRSDPGEVAAATASETRRDNLPSNARRRPSQTMHFGAQSRGLRAPCERFAPWVTPGPRITRFRLAADLGRMGLDTHRVSNKVSKITSRHLVPLDRAFPAHALVHGSRALGEPRSTSWPSWRQQVHDLDMKSRVHPQYKTKYHVGNWPAYDRALVQRGDITVWLAPDAIAAWEAVGVGNRGGQRQYSDLAIETALTLRLIFHLPLRQTEGFLTSIFGMLGLDLSAPDHTTLSRRGQHLDLPLRRAPTGAGLHLMVDSTGLSIVGEGEWAAAKHGGRGRRGWKKLHFGVDRSGVIVARALTEASVDDATTGITLIEAVDGALGQVTADAAYDTIGFYEAAGARGATVVVPPTSTAHVSRHGPRSSARDRTILAVKERGRRRWKKTSGYHGQARVENAFFRYKSIIGDSLRACSPAGRGTEVDLACNILNQMTGLGRPMSYRIGR